MSETSTRLYELGYILAPTVPESEVNSHVESLKKAISAIEGTFKSEGNPEFIDLAYQMEKHIGSRKMKYSQGYFGWIKFESAPEAMESLKKTLDGMEALVRYILVKTSVENTIVFKKPKGEAKREPLMEELESTESLEEEVEDMQEDHEKLPDLADDVETAAPASKEEATT